MRNLCEINRPSSVGMVYEIGNSNDGKAPREKERGFPSRFFKGLCSGVDYGCIVSINSQSAQEKHVAVGIHMFGPCFFYLIYCVVSKFDV